MERYLSSRYHCSPALWSIDRRSTGRELGWRVMLQRSRTGYLVRRNSPARHSMRLSPPDAVLALLWPVLASAAQPFLDAEACASFNFCAHSSQHTSTVLPPILTSMALASSL